MCEGPSDHPLLDEEAVNVPILRWWHWMIIVLTDIIGPFSSDSYIPNIPAMQKELHASSVEAGLTLQANWLAKGLATIAIGAMADSKRFGRRGALLCAFVLYVSGTAGSAQVPASQLGAKLLIVSRVVQGIGESGTVVCSAIARDVLVDVRERVRMLALLGTLRPIAIVCAPSLGGLLGSAFGWRNVFRALSVWGAALFVAVAAFLPETRPAATISGATFDGFRVVLARLTAGDVGARFALAAVVILAFGFAGVLSFLSNVSILFEGRYGLGVVVTSLLIGSVPTVIIINNSVVARLFSRGRKDQVSDAVSKAVGIIKLSLAGFLVAGAANLILAFAPLRNPLRTKFPWLLADVYLYAYVQSASVGPTMAIAIEPFGDCAGAAAAFNNIVRTLVSTGVAQAATDLVDAFSVRGLFVILAFTAFACQLTWPFLARVRPLRVIPEPLLTEQDSAPPSPVSSGDYVELPCEDSA